MYFVEKCFRVFCPNYRSSGQKIINGISNKFFMIDIVSCSWTSKDLFVSPWDRCACCIVPASMLEQKITDYSIINRVVVDGCYRHTVRVLKVDYRK